MVFRLTNFNFDLLSGDLLLSRYLFLRTAASNVLDLLFEGVLTCSEAHSKVPLLYWKLVNACCFQLLGCICLVFSLIIAAACYSFSR